MSDLDPGLYVTRVHPDGERVTVRLDAPGPRAAIRSAVVVGSTTNRYAMVSQGRAGNIAKAVIQMLMSVTEKESPG